MRKQLQKSIWLLLVVAMLVTMCLGVSGTALAADETPAEPDPGTNGGETIAEPAA